MRKYFGFDGGPGVLIVAGEGTCGMTLTWRGKSWVVLGLGWPGAWGFHRTHRWAYLVLGVIMFGLRRNVCDTDGVE